MHFDFLNNMSTAYTFEKYYNILYLSLCDDNFVSYLTLENVYLFDQLIIVLI